jgi:ABC-type nitrate/sulfonate/bicarbonate transport system permease component
MRVSLAVALIVMVVSEMVAASSGIGYFILSAERGFQIDEMFAGVLTLAVLGYALNRLFLMIEAFPPKRANRLAGMGVLP